MTETVGKMKIVIGGDHADHGKARLVCADIAKAVFDSAGALRFFLLAPDRARRQRKSAMMKATKENALTKNAVAAPQSPTIMPAD